MVMQFELYRTLNPAMKRPMGSLRHETSPPKFSASGRQRCRLHRASLGRKPIRPDRCASSFPVPQGRQWMCTVDCTASGFRNVFVSHSFWKTGQGPPALSTLRRPYLHAPPATHSSFSRFFLLPISFPHRGRELGRNFEAPMLPCAITAAPAVGPPRPLCAAGRSSRRRLRRA